MALVFSPIILPFKPLNVPRVWFGWQRILQENGKGWCGDAPTQITEIPAAFPLTSTTDSPVPTSDTLASTAAPAPARVRRHADECVAKILGELQVAEAQLFLGSFGFCDSGRFHSEAANRRHRMPPSASPSAGTRHAARWLGGSVARWLGGWDSFAGR